MGFCKTFNELPDLGMTSDCAADRTDHTNDRPLVEQARYWTMLSQWARGDVIDLGQDSTAGAHSTDISSAP